MNRLAFKFQFCVLLLSAMFAHVSSQSTPNKLTIQDIFNLETVSDPQISPDGKYLLMSANRNQDYEREARDTNVYEFSVADGAVRALTTRKGPDNSPQISPDGKLIAYVGYEDKYQGYQVTQLHVMNRDGSNQRVISSKWDRDVANARWAGDGSGLYFTSDDQGATGLYFITLGGDVKKLLGNVGSGTSAYGGGGAFSIAKNGAFAIAQCNPRNPGDVADGMLSDGKVKVLTAVNEDLFAGKQIGEVEEIWYQSSKDNRKIQGWIIKPPGFGWFDKHKNPENAAPSN